MQLFHVDRQTTSFCESNEVPFDFIIALGSTLLALVQLIDIYDDFTALLLLLGTK